MITRNYVSTTARLRWPLAKQIVEHELSISELLDIVQAFTEAENYNNSDVVITHNGNKIELVIYEYETELDYDIRMAALKKRAFEHQAEADRKWARQKAKFARARK